jgi:hypothetical protein
VSFTGTRFSVSDLQIATWNELFPGVSVEMEIAKAHAWLLVRNKRKRDYEKYMFNWLKRTHNDLLRAEVRSRVKETQARKEAMAGRGPSEARIGGGAKREIREKYRWPVYMSSHDG